MTLVGGVVPNRNDAYRLINASGGQYIREEIHRVGGNTHHTYWHMHYSYMGYENALQFTNGGTEGGGE